MGKLLPKCGDYVKTDLFFIICASSLFLELKNPSYDGYKKTAQNGYPIQLPLTFIFILLARLF
jgi:hypothetical protein